MRVTTSLAAALFLATAGAASAQEAETIEFAGGKLTITEQADSIKVLAFDGSELAQNYYVFFDGVAEVDGTEVALFEVGEGGNACGSNTLIVWKPEGEAVEAVKAGDDCGSPPASISDYGIYFVPYPLPGESQTVQMWSPATGMQVAGLLSYAAQPGTGWSDLDASPDHIMDAFGNEAVYEASRALLGDELTEVARGLSVGGKPTAAGPDLFWSHGCVPHACGSSDSFMAVDRAAQKVYFAQQQESGAPKSWPEAATWPEPLRAAMVQAIGR